MANVLLNGQPVIQLNLHLVTKGAWSAELQVASDAAPTVGDAATLTVLDLTLAGRVSRTGTFADRVSLRLTGGAVEWTGAVTAKHYKDVTVDLLLKDLGLTLDQSNQTKIEFWTRQVGTVGQAVEEIAQRLGFNWRINPDGTLLMRAESPTPVDGASAVQQDRDTARGIVTLALNEEAPFLPGTKLGDDVLGDVLYEVDSSAPLRCRYYTEARGVLRGAMERLVRWVMRDSIYLGQYTAKVERQASDGSLDLTPDDVRLRATGLQSVPIRHGLPGCEVDVPVGELVLLAFDAGDPRKPYAALWHEGQITAVRIGGKRAVAMADLTKARIDALQQAVDTHIHPTGVGPSGPNSAPIGPLDDVSSTVVFTR